MTTRPNAVPLRPDYGAAGLSQSKSFWRGVTAIALGRLRNEPAAKIVERHWSGDYVAKAVTAPDSTTSSAKEMLSIGYTGLLTGLGPQSAAAKLFFACSRVDFANTNEVIIPAVTTAAPAPPFVAENSPHTVVQSVLGSVRLGPAANRPRAVVRRRQSSRA